MTKLENLRRIIKRLHNNDYTYKHYLESAGIVRMAEKTALDLWLKEIPEDDDTRELRRQINYLNKHGQWDMAD